MKLLDRDLEIQRPHGSRRSRPPIGVSGGGAAFTTGTVKAGATS